MGRGVGGPSRVLTGSPRIWKAVERRSKRFAALLKRSGRVGNPVALAAESLSLAIYGALVAVPVSLAAAVLVSPWCVLGCLAPLVLFYLPDIRLGDEIARRREGVERELPFFSVLVGVLGGAGVPLYSILEDLTRSDVFPAMRGEALLVKRDVGIFGMNPNESFERLAASHPSPRFAEFLLGYASKVRSGGDVPAFLSAESGSLLRDLEEGWVRYVARVGIVGSLMITVFGVVPLLLMVVGVFSPAFSMVGLAAFAAVGVPLFTLALVYMTGRLQPAREEPYRGKWPMGLALAVPGGVLGSVLGAPWMGAAAFLLVFFVAYGASVREQLAEARALDEGVSRFLKDLLEYKRQDYDLSRAILAIEAQGGFDRRFAKLLARVAARLKAGVPLDEVRVECRSRVGRLAFLLLGQMSRSGGGSVDTVFQVSSFSDRMIQMRRSASAEMKPYLVLSYVSPLLLAFGVTFVGGVLSTFSSHLGPGFRSLSVPVVQAASPGLSGVADLLIVVSAASLGLIGAKITDFTVKNTVRSSVNVALAVAAVAVMGVLGSHSLAGLFFR